MRKTHFTKALCFLLSFCMVFSGFVFAVPTMETVESVVEPTETAADDTTLTAVGIKPGLNMLTQTTEPYGYETEEEANSFKSVITEYYTPNGEAKVISNPAKDEVNGSEKVLTLSCSLPNDKERYPSFRFYTPATIEAKRPIYVSFKYKKTYTPAAGESYTEAQSLWVMKGGNVVKDVGGFSYNAAWKKFSGLLDFSKATVPGTTTVDPSDVKNILIQGKLVKTAGTTDFMFDDLLYVPSYKATFYLNDGTDTVLKSEYFLLDSNGNIMTSYPLASAPKASRFGYIFKGWSLSKDSTTADAPETIALNNEDIALYAVWEKDENVTAYVHRWNFDDTSKQVWVKNNYGYAIEYKDGVLVVNNHAENRNGTTPYLSHPAVSLNTEDYRYLVVRAKSSGVTGIQFYFRTSDYPSNSEDQQIFLPIDGNSDTFKEYYVDMSTNARWTGNYTGCMFAANSGEGTIEFEEIYFATRPNYECIYLMNDGTDKIAATRYFLLDDDGKLITAYTPDASIAPTRYGYFFKGWALTADATVDDIVSSIDVEETNTLYAVWEKDPDTPDATTYKWDFEDASSQVWTKANKGYSTEYKNGMLIVNTAAETYEGTPYLKHPNVSLNTKSHRYLVVKARNLNTVKQVRFYFTTSDHPNAADVQTVVIPFDQNSKVFKEYYYDMSQNQYWTGDYKNCMFKFEGGSGVVELEEIYFTTLYEPEEDVSNEYHYSNSEYSAWGHTSITANEDGTVTITRSGTGNEGAMNIKAPSISLDASVYNKLIIKAKDNSGISGFRVYYSSSDYPSYNETQTASSVVSSITDGDYKYYVVDLSTRSDFKGTVKTFMISVNGAGSMTVSDIYIADKIIAPKSEIIEKIGLYATSNEITEDNGQVTIRPYVRYGDGRETTEADFVTDTVNAQLTKNEDGSLTLTGKLNGTITVTALIKGVSEARSITINISGQPDRMAVNDYRVLVFGNSIARHGIAPSIGWNRLCGMAASSEENDYAHRLQYYMNEKFGANSTTLKVGTSIAGFERSIATDDLEADYSSMISSFVEDVKLFRPDVISIQMGENVNTNPTTESYRYAVTCLVKALRDEAPDATIVVCTPFWGGSSRIEGMKLVADDLDLGLALVHTLNSRENMAWDDASLKDAIDGVKNHPGDLGMDRIAKLIFDQANARLTLNDRTEYTTIPQDIKFADGTVTEITKADAFVKLSANVLPATAPQAVTWTVSDKNLAVISEDGVLTAKNDGVVTVTVTSKYDESLSASLNITISGQTTPFTVTYDKNTTDTVTELPEPNKFAKNTFVFDDGYPVRETYKFLGWALTPDGEPVKSIEITGDVTVYAKWELAKSWSFDTDGYKENFTIDNGFNQYVLDGKFMSIATNTNVSTGEVLKVNSPKLNLGASEYYALLVTMQNTEISTDTVLDMTIHATGGDVKFQEKVVTREYTTYCFKLNKVSGTITGFEFTPTNVDCTINLDEIAFVESPILGYDENTTDEVSGMPAGEFKNLGEITVSDAIPTRSGYTFLGWSEKKDSKLLAGLTVNVEEPGKILYAVWDKNDHWEFDNDELSSVGNVTDTQTKVIDGILHYDTPASSYDPIVYVKNQPNFPTSSTSGKIRVKMKWNNLENRNTSTQIFFKTSTAPSLAEANSASTSNAAYGSAPSDWVYVDIDFTSRASWSGVLNYLRFDLTTVPGTCDVDYIRFTNSEANIVAKTGKTLTVRPDDWATYLVAEGGTLAPLGSAYIKNLYLTGDIDFANGAIIVTDTVEIAEANKSNYAVFTLDMASAGVSASDYMYVGGYDKPVEMKDGAKYLVKLNENGVGFVYFGSKTDVSKKVLYKLTATGEEKMDTTFTTTDTAVSVRTAAPVGVRFRAMVANKLLAATEEKEGFSVKEYGFLVSIAKQINSPDELNMAAVEAGKAVKGVAHDENTNIIYSSNDQEQVITAVLTGIPNTKEAYNMDLYVRPYVVLSNGMTVYGNPVVDTMYSIASGIAETLTGSEPYAEFIYNIIEVAEG